MARMSFSSPIAFVAVWFAVMVVGGCSASPEQQMKEAYRNAYRENGRRLVALYTQCMAMPGKPVRGPDDFTGPADESELRAFIRKSPEEWLADMGITNPDGEDLFKSERDGMPFRIRYGFKGGINAVFAVLCEAKGKNGKIRVFKSDGSSIEVPADEGEACLAGKYDQSKPKQP
jgi:hypothetical protein